MKNTITVFSDETDLSRQAWRFWYGPRGMVLDAWRHERRATRRHKWFANNHDGSVWTRLMQRDNRVVRPNPPESVVKAALEGFAASLTYAETPDAD